MPLSEHEQQLLDQIERALYAEDPKFASTVRGARLRRRPRRRRLQGIVLFILGMGLLVGGLILPVRVAEIPILSVIGFLVWFFGAVLLVTSFRSSPDEGEEAEGGAKPGGGKAKGKSTKRDSLANRMEQRLRRRFERE